MDIIACRAEQGAWRTEGKAISVYVFESSAVPRDLAGQHLRNRDQAPQGLDLSRAERSR